MRLSEQYVEALNDILTMSNVVMVPEDQSQGGASPSNVAGMMAMYNQLIGSNSGSEKVSASLASGSDQVLHQIVQNQEELKRKGVQKESKPSKYSYLDDKVLYDSN